MNNSPFSIIYFSRCRETFTIDETIEHGIANEGLKQGNGSDIVVIVMNLIGVLLVQRMSLETNESHPVVPEPPP